MEEQDPGSENSSDIQRERRKLPPKDNWARWEDRAVDQYVKFLRTHLSLIETALKGQARSAKLVMTITIKEGDGTGYAVDFRGKPDIPWFGDEAKAEFVKGQLQLL
jgi:hypothetical protein